MLEIESHVKCAGIGCNKAQQCERFLSEESAQTVWASVYALRDKSLSVCEYFILAKGNEIESN